MIHSLLSKLLLWNDGDPCGAFVGDWVIKNYFKNKKAFNAKTQPWIVYFKSGTLEFSRFSSVQQVPGVGAFRCSHGFAFKFYQKLRTTGNLQETFQGWMRQNFPSHTGNFHLWGVSVLPDFIAFPKTFVCLFARTWRSQVKTCNRCILFPLCDISQSQFISLY